MTEDPPQAQLRQQVRELERRLDETREELAEIKTHGATALELIGLDTPTGRRQAMKYAGGAAALPTLAALSMAEPARADAVAADVGTQADPWQKGWFHALAAGDGRTDLAFDSPLSFNHTAITSATTVSDANVIEYDPSVAGFTTTIGTPLEERGLPVILQETGGSSNTVTVDTQSGNNIDGSASISLSHANARTVLYFEGGEWRTDFFTERVDARKVVGGSFDISGAGTLYQPNDFAEVFTSAAKTESNQTTSSTSFAKLTAVGGGFDLSNIPAAATLYGLALADMSIDDGAETFDIQPQVVDTGRSFTSLTELRLSTSSTSNTIVNSGWTEITSVTGSDFFLTDALNGRVSAGTATGTLFAGRYALLIGWRID